MLYSIDDIYEMLMDVSSSHDAKLINLMKDIKQKPVLYKEIFSPNKFSKESVVVLDIWEMMFRTKSLDFIKKFESLIDFSLTTKSGDNILGLSFSVDDIEITNYLFEMIKRKNIPLDIWLGSVDNDFEGTQHTIKYGVLLSLMNTLTPDNVYILDNVADILPIRESASYVEYMLSSDFVDDNTKRLTIKNIKDKGVKLIELPNNILRLLSEYEDREVFYILGNKFMAESFIGRDNIEKTISNIESKMMREEKGINPNSPKPLKI